VALTLLDADGAPYTVGGTVAAVDGDDLAAATG
jgi:hypothetical protein